MTDNTDIDDSGGRYIKSGCGAQRRLCLYCAWVVHLHLCMAREAQRLEPAYWWGTCTAASCQTSGDAYMACLRMMSGHWVLRVLQCHSLMQYIRCRTAALML
jgi:hypothetical protein